MIAYLKGKLAHKDRAHVIIDVNGVGYEVKISLQTYAALADGVELCKLYTHLQVKEDSHTLVGFHSMDEKLLFLDLISVSGIGLSTALVMLSSFSSSKAFDKDFTILASTASSTIFIIFSLQMRVILFNYMI